MPVHDWSRVKAGLFHHFHLNWISALCTQLNSGELQEFVDKAVDFIRQGIHVLIIDVLPPTRRDPQGIHKAIWDEIDDEPFELPSDKRLTLASYSAGIEKVAYVEPVAVGDVLPSMPLFLEPEIYIPASLDATYETTWSVCPSALKDAVLANGTDATS
jgi:hypothetical protein